MGKNLPAIRGTRVRSLDQEDLTHYEQLSPCITTIEPVCCSYLNPCAPESVRRKEE